MTGASTANGGAGGSGSDDSVGKSGGAAVATSAITGANSTSAIVETAMSNIRLASRWPGCVALSGRATISACFPICSMCRS